MTVLIEKASLEDLEALSVLFEAYRKFYRQKPNPKAAKLFLSERISNNESIIYIAKTPEGMAVGFTQIYPIFSSTRMKRLWLLNDLYVSESHRGQGISIKLINKAKLLAKSTAAAGILLETEKTNIPGNQLYPKTGFHLENETNFYFWTNNESS